MLPGLNPPAILAFSKGIVGENAAGRRNDKLRDQNAATYRACLHLKLTRVFTLPMPPRM